MYMFMQHVVVMVTELFMQDLVLCKAKGVALSDDGTKATDLVSNCTITCDLRHLKGLDHSIASSSKLKRISEELLLKAQQASLPVNNKMGDYLALCSSGANLREFIQASLKKKCLKHVFTLLPLPAVLHAIGLNAQNKYTRFFKVEDSSYNALDAILGGFWDCKDNGESYKFVRSVQFQVHGIFLKCTVATSYTSVPFNRLSYREVATANLYPAL